MTRRKGIGGRKRARKALRQAQLRIGLILVILVVAVALLGPLFAPHGPAALVGPTYGLPEQGALLGYDYLGRDIWSRLLAGGFAGGLVGRLAVGSHPRHSSPLWSGLHAPDACSSILIAAMASIASTSAHPDGDDARFKRGRP